MQPPNVLILMCDQMQARRMGFVDGMPAFLKQHALAGPHLLESEAQEALSAEADGWWRRTGGRDLATYESQAFKDGMG